MKTNHTKYIDLSIRTDQVIDIKYHLDKISNNAYSTFALDYEFIDDSFYKGQVSQFCNVAQSHPRNPR